LTAFSFQTNNVSLLIPPRIPHPRIEKQSSRQRPENETNCAAFFGHPATDISGL
jgi:hypothetical protein